jgi:hypothetical protein
MSSNLLEETIDGYTHFYKIQKEQSHFFIHWMINIILLY